MDSTDNICLVCSVKSLIHLSLLTPSIRFSETNQQENREISCIYNANEFQNSKRTFPSVRKAMPSLLWDTKTTSSKIHSSTWNTDHRHEKLYLWILIWVHKFCHILYLSDILRCKFRQVSDKSHQHNVKNSRRHSDQQDCGVHPGQGDAWHIAGSLQHGQAHLGHQRSKYSHQSCLLGSWYPFPRCRFNETTSYVETETEKVLC